jgi:C_GCAxxG_C_C family probable redox protein
LKIMKTNTGNGPILKVADQVALVAEQLYRSGKMHCAEAVLAAVKQVFAPQIPDEVVQMAGGFGGGSGAGCICGAVSGGTMALGLAMAGDKKSVAVMTRELHRWFKEDYGATCCKILTAHGKSGCVKLTASVAGRVAELLLETGLRPTTAATTVSVGEVEGSPVHLAPEIS